MYGIRSDIQKLWQEIGYIQKEVHHVQKDVSYISGRFDPINYGLLRESHGLRGEGQPGDD